MAEHDNEKWVEVYREAITEVRQSLMAGRIANARAEIVKRVAALRDIPGLHKYERQAIEDALQSLGFLEREDAAISAEDEKEKAAEALKRLSEIESGEPHVR